ncbi:Death ligand signal enhancer [Trichinella spiralis]|uniref:Death ligand signal enhancer n=1 Tax=Trichinella spiralis TaxID=6334 RepID=A0A0V1C257_TRISP|nr:Death ligand signal enhancer [Trichinella spiralis]
MKCYEFFRCCMKFHLFKGNFHPFATRSAMSTFSICSFVSAVLQRERRERNLLKKSTLAMDLLQKKSTATVPVAIYAVLLLGYQLSQYIEVYRSRRNQHFVCFCFVKENLYNLLNTILCSSRTIAHRVLPLSLANNVELKHPNNNASSSSDNFPQLRCIVHDAAVQTDTNFLNIDRLISECSDCLNKELEARLYYLIGLDLLHVNLYEKALDYLLKSCKYNYSKALYNVGLCYYKGYGCVQSDEKAVKFWNSAAERGNGLAMYQLGVVYLKGLAGLKCNAELGLAYMNRAAESGVVEAKTYLGALLFKSGDNQGALNLWKEAASCGHEEAKHFLESNFSTQC